MDGLPGLMQRELDRLSRRFPEYQKGRCDGFGYLGAQYRPLKGRGCLALSGQATSDRLHVIMDRIETSGLGACVDVVILEWATAETARAGCTVASSGVSARLIVPRQMSFCGASLAAIDWCRGRSLPLLMRGMSGDVDCDDLVRALDMLEDGADLVALMPPREKPCFVAGDLAGVVGFSQSRAAWDVLSMVANGPSDEICVRALAIAARQHADMRSVIVEDDRFALSGSSGLGQRLSLWRDMRKARSLGKARKRGSS